METNIEQNDNIEQPSEKGGSMAHFFMLFIISESNHFTVYNLLIYNQYLLLLTITNLFCIKFK